MIGKGKISRCLFPNADTDSDRRLAPTEDNDDVQEVYANFDIADDLIEEASA